jgi:hypothetical protein
MSSNSWQSEVDCHGRMGGGSPSKSEEWAYCSCHMDPSASCQPDPLASCEYGAYPQPGWYLGVNPCVCMVGYHPVMCVGGTSGVGVGGGWPWRKRDNNKKLTNRVMLVKNKSNNPRALLGDDELKNFLRSFLALKLCEKWNLQEVEQARVRGSEMESVRVRRSSTLSSRFYGMKHRPGRTEGNG